jgi:hypothetical protein
MLRPERQPGQLTDLTPDFERDLLEEKVGIDVDRNVFATVLEYGLADRIDVGVVVPFVKLDMHTRVFSQILRTATPSTDAEEHGNTIPIHAFDPLGLSDRTTYASAHSRGIGDIVVRGKAHPLKTEEGGISVAVNVSVPTGDRRLSGPARGSSARHLVGAVRAGRRSLNGGYTTSGGSLPSARPRRSIPVQSPGRGDELLSCRGDQRRRRRRWRSPAVGITGDIIARQLRNLALRGAAPLRAARPSSPAPSRWRATCGTRPGNLTQIRRDRCAPHRPAAALGVDAAARSGDGLMPKVGVVAGFSRPSSRIPRRPPPGASNR